MTFTELYVGSQTGFFTLATCSPLVNFTLDKVVMEFTRCDETRKDV